MLGNTVKYSISFEVLKNIFTLEILSSFAKQKKECRISMSCY